MSFPALVLPAYTSLLSENIARMIEGNDLPPFEVEMFTATQKQVWIHLHASLLKDPDGKIAGIQCIARNITEEKNLAKQLLHSQKMEAIGTLAGGIAHDFNNLLTVILGTIDIINIKLSPKDKMVPKLDNIKNAATRAKELVNQLIQFGRMKRTEKKTISLRLMLEEACRFLNALVSKNITIEADLAEDPCYVKAEEAGITQIVVNLGINARDAMPSGGKLKFATDIVTLDESSGTLHIDAHPGRYCRLRAIDTGIGMSAELKERIFEPFFTTKEKTQGTGLGLSTVYGLVRDLGGFIIINSTPGKGSEFHIYIPEAPGEKKEAEKDGAASEPGGGTILLADDEEEILELGKTVLEMHGYSILIAKNTVEAISLYKENEHDIKLVILDMNMPGGSGVMALEAIHSINPKVPVIVSSGFSDAHNLDNTEKNMLSYLPKPYVPEEMVSLVREVLKGHICQPG
jgi:signal transduction histidine kinase/CheY-like chemotaxis protein